MRRAASYIAWRRWRMYTKCILFTLRVRQMTSVVIAAGMLIRMKVKGSE